MCGSFKYGAAILALTIGSLSTAGCGGAGSARVDAVELTLGTAAHDGSGFLPLSGDQTLVEGAQGGFHIWIKYRIAGMGADRLLIDRTARRASDARLILDVPEALIDVGAPSADGYWEIPSALPSFMCPAPIGVSVIDQPIDFDVVLKDQAGTELAHATATATPHCPSDAETFCQQICSGQ